jgi:hypothetical protein
VSTILEALRQREPRLTPAAGNAIAWIDLREWSAWRWALVVGLTAAAASIPLIRSGPGTEPRRPELASHLPQPPPAREPVTRSATVPSMADRDEPPRARVERRRSLGPPVVAAEAAPPAVVPSAPAPVAAPATADSPQQAVAAPPTVAAPSEPQAQPAVRLRSIGYAAAPEKRTATLAIDGAPAVTLRQGESAGGIEVQLILREAVYVRHGPDIFAVEVER